MKYGHTSTQPIPHPADEPMWMKMSTLVGAKAGAAIFRDNRCWHGATPNLSTEIRALPNVEYTPAWRAAGYGVKSTSPCRMRSLRSSLRMVNGSVPRLLRDLGWR